jgi:hypothetical protein
MVLTTLSFVFYALLGMTILLNRHGLIGLAQKLL